MADSALEDDENYKDISSELINFPPEVQRAIEKVLPSDDPLDQPDFNCVDYINSIFPTEQSLTNLDDVVNKIEFKIQNIDEEIRSVVRGQSNAGQDGRVALDEAQKVIRQLFNQITDIKRKAEVSEETVREITRDIKQLDTAKRNLTAAIKTLNHWHMLVGGVEDLKALTSKRQYGEIVPYLQAVTEVMKHFDSFTDIPQIKLLSDQVREIQKSLAEQITKEFHDSLSGPNAKSFVPKQLAEACLVIAILDPKIKKDILKWFVGVQLSEYLVLFHESEDVAWLDKLDRRYAWFKRHLIQCEEKFGAMFPPNWDVSEHITVEFCTITKSELSKIMAKRKNEIDVKLLLYAIQKTVHFENLLAKRFSGRTLNRGAGEGTVNVTLSDQLDDSATFDVASEDSDKQKLEVKTKVLSPFSGIISDCFQAYLYIYIQSLDKDLVDLLERFAADAKTDVAKELGLPGSSVGVLPSCADFFLFYKKCLVQCSQLSNGTPMLHLAETFQKYLKQYAQKVLKNNIPKLGGSSTSISVNVTNITRDLRDLSAAAGLIQNLLKEGETARFNRQEQAGVCCILTTAEYCLETTIQLEEKLKEKIEPGLAEKINLSQEQDTFHDVITNCIQLLVKDLDMACEPALTAMGKIQWSNVEQVGDQSSYVSAITSHLKTTVPLIRDYLSSSRKYFTQICIKFADSFIPKFIQCLFKCKPVGTAGAEQLLLDAHMLKTVLLDLPSIGSQVSRKPPASFTKVVIKGMTKAEMILKVVLNHTEPDHTAFVDHYIKLLPNSDIVEFQKILDMKGLKTAEKNQLTSLFKTRNSGGSQSVSSPAHDSSNRKLLKKF